jgi:hypothetical protein
MFSNCSFLILKFFIFRVRLQSAYHMVIRFAIYYPNMNKKNICSVSQDGEGAPSLKGLIGQWLKLRVSETQQHNQSSFPR